MRGDRPPSSKEVGWWLSGCLLLAPQISEGPCLTTQCVALSHVLIALFCYLLHIFHDTHVSYVYLLIISSLEKTWIPRGRTFPVMAAWQMLTQCLSHSRLELRSNFQSSCFLGSGMGQRKMPQRKKGSSHLPQIEKVESERIAPQKAAFGQYLPRSHTYLNSNSISAAHHRGKRCWTYLSSSPIAGKPGMRIQILQKCCENWKMCCI